MAEISSLRVAISDDKGTVFSASNLGITQFEDCAIVKGHDGKFYMFLDDFTGGTNKDVYCVQSDYADFRSYTSKGKIITQNNIRVVGAIYDSEDAEYIVYIWDKNDNTTDAFYIAQASFPNGTWTNAGQVNQDVLRQVFYENGVYKAFVSVENVSPTGCTWATSSNPRGTFSNGVLFQGGDLPYYANGIDIRGTYKVGDLYLMGLEGYTAVPRWEICFVTITADSNGYYAQVAGNPFWYGSISYANLNTILEDNSIVYLYYQKTDTGASDFKHQCVAILEVITSKDLVREVFTSTPAGGKWEVPAGVTEVEVLVVAGGGKGGTAASGRAGGGGGAGGVLYSAAYSVTPEGEITVTVGAGGTSANGENSVFGTLTATGGGKGGDYGIAGSSGGSGGGGGDRSMAGGSETSGQGRVGGLGAYYHAGGGGGWGAAGGAGNNDTGGGAGGKGVNYTAIFGSDVGASGWFAGGGGGGWGGIGGTGGGGAGGTAGTGVPGTANTGGGGGGAYNAAVAGANGGSGIVIISYEATAFQPFRNYYPHLLAH